MRQADREVKDLREIIAIMNRCDVCRLALNGDGFPYIIPLNFGLVVEGDKLTLLFHSAQEGTKLDLMRLDNRTSFEMDCGHQLQYFKEKGYCTMAYESVTGHGHIRFLTDGEKENALKAIMAKYHPGEDAPFNPAAMQRTCVYCLEVEGISAKRKLPK